MEDLRRQVAELQRQNALLMRFMQSFENPGQVAPQHVRTIQAIIGNLTLDDLSGVTISSPSNGQVLKYNGSAWVNGTDDIGTL